MKVKPWIVSSVGSAGLFAAQAQAHIGLHGAGLSSGVAHPFTGLDHLLAMVAVGLWAAQQGGKVRWAVPAAFVAMMGIGGVLGMLGMHLPGVDAGIAASVLALGLLITFSARLPLAAGMALVGAFAIFHGHAHGAEMPSVSAPWLYAFGFILSTLFLHGVGVGAGMAMKGKRDKFLRLGGAALSCAGVWMLVGI